MRHSMYANRLFLCVVGDATVTISHRYTPKDQLRQHTQIADIVVAAAGLFQLWLNCLDVTFFYLNRLHYLCCLT